MKKMSYKENILIMLKKSVSLLVIFFIIILSSGCKKTERLDFSELLIRTEKFNDSLDADIDRAFYSDGCWYLFFSVAAENDVLLKAQEDENMFLTKVSITTMDSGQEISEQAFIDVARAVTEAFCALEDTESFAKGTGLYDDIIFSDELRHYEEGRYTADFFNSPLGASLIIEIR